MQDLNNDIGKKREIPFFFILGRPRSGTTLLSTMLDANPAVILPFECRLLMFFFPGYYKTRIWTEKKIRKFHRLVVNLNNIGSWRIDSDKLLHELLAHKNETDFRILLRTVYLNFNSFFAKEEILLTGDKNPLYCFYPGRLLKLFPDAKFIHITRDFRDQILSCKKMDFEAPVTALLAYRWKISIKRILKAAKSKPDLFFSIRYEALVAEPEKCLQDICRFLGIPFSAEMLNFHAKKDELLLTFPRESIQKYHQSLLEPVTTSKTDGWKTLMTESELNTAEAVVGKMAENSGYPRLNRQKSWPAYLKSLPWICYGCTDLFIRQMLDYFPVFIKNFFSGNRIVLAHLYRRINRALHGKK